MRALPADARTRARRPALLRVARRVMWFEEPERALADPLQFLAHLMVFGGVEYLKALRGIVRKNEYRGSAPIRPARHLRRAVVGLLEFGL